MILNTIQKTKNINLYNLQFIKKKNMKLHTLDIIKIKHLKNHYNIQSYMIRFYLK